MAPLTVAELARLIADNTTRVTDYLNSRKLPLPTFDGTASSEFTIPADAPPEIEAARQAVIDATRQLRILMLGPREYLMTFQHNELISFQAIIRYKLAAAVPLDGEASYAQIATASGVDEILVRRFIRHAITKAVFQEVRKGVVKHTAASRLLAIDEQLADWMGVNTDELWQSASQTLNAMTQFPNSAEPNETGFALANGSSKTTYEIIGQSPERARRFASSMKAFTEGRPYSTDHLVHNYPWELLSNGTVVDVGGSNGFVSFALAQAHPNLKCVVQDLPSVITSEIEAKVPTALRSRIQFQAYDFLTQEQPSKDADVYFFRWIFHNWSDKYATTIIRNMIPALKPGARVLVMDNVLPEPGILPNAVEGRLRSMDLTMTEMQNARERELEEWKALFESTDSRFKFQGGSKPEGSNLWILEARWQP